VLFRSAVFASLEDPTPEGRTTIELARPGEADGEPPAPAGRTAVPFSAITRLSGTDLPDGTMVRKGAEGAILGWLKHEGHQQPKAVSDDLAAHTSAIARTGGTPLVVAVKAPGEDGRVLGVIHLKDVVKAGVTARFEKLREMGVRTIMVTGDNPLTAQAIAAEAGIDDFLGDATPEKKLDLIKSEQAAGHFVAMSGDGVNDAPALAQADVGLAMNSATAAAKDASNIVVLDDDPTKIVEVIETARRLMATRGALTTFNIANDIVRYIAIFPILFVGTFPGLDALNLLRLHSPASAILSTLLFSSLVIGVLIPLAIVGVPYRLTDLGRALRRNILFYGVGGVVVPAIAIKLIDLLVSLLPGY
jgi:K+-transporting ATPase ATPase B chain